VHPQLGEVNYEVEELPADPDAQVERTVARACRYAIEDSQSLIIRQDAQLAVRLGNGDPIEGIYRLVRGRMRFQQDYDTAAQLPPNFELDPDDVVEILVRPVDISQGARLTQSPVGEDCDGFTMYCASLLLAAGIPCTFATLAADEREPLRYSHVYVVAYPTLPDGSVRRTPMDCSHGQYPGWEAPNEFGRLKEWVCSYDTVDGAGEWGILAAIAAIAGAVVYFLSGRHS